jgi:hypothetical protein
MNSAPPPSRFPLRALCLFFGLTFVPAWLGLAWLRASGRDFGWNQTGSTALALLALGLLPGLAALVAAGALPVAPGPVLVGRTQRKGFLVLALLVLPLLGALAAGVSVLMTLATWDFSLLGVHREVLLCVGPAHHGLIPLFPPPGWKVWLFSLAISPWIFLPLAWAEEAGWRGFGFAWLRPRGFWTAALGLGALTWLWRLPLLAWGCPYPGHPWLGPVLGLGFQLGFGVLAAWLREKSGGILAPALARATLSGAALMPLSLTVDYDPLLAHLQGAVGVGLMGLLLLFGLWAGLFPKDRPDGGKGYDRSLQS